MRTTIPQLLTEEEAAAHAVLTLEVFLCKKLSPAGSYTPPRGKPIPLFSRKDVERVRA